MTNDVRELKMAEYCAKVVASTEWFKEDFTFQTGAGGASLAVTRFLKNIWMKRILKWAGV